MAEILDDGPIYDLPPYVVEQVYIVLAQTIDWGVSLLGIPGLWSRTRGQGIRVAILDTGASPNHPDLGGAIVEAKDFTGSASGAADRQGHSTHCCGIVAARNNDVGTVGVAPEAVLLCGKVLGDNGSGSSAAVANGILWAIEQKADIISMSLGSPQPDRRIESAVSAALKAGIYVIAAAGNDGPSMDTVGYPASYPGVIAVGSIDRRKHVSRFSSRGNRVDIVAPGDQITSCWPNGGYATLSGTSMATPFVAGVVALLLSARKQIGLGPLGPGEMVDLLHLASIDIDEPGPDPHAGFGLIDPDKLLSSVASPVPIPVPIPVPVPAPVPPAPIPIPVPPSGGSFMGMLLSLIDQGLSLFEFYARGTATTDDDAIARVLRLALNLVQKWHSGPKPTEAEVDIVLASIKAKLLGG